MRRLSDNDQAQTSIDFLTGVTIFLFAFIFVFSFLPGMFQPFQSNSDELTMTADRLAVTLVENELAVGTDNKLIGIIDKVKVDTLKTSMAASDNATLREGLGLKSGNHLYNCEIIIEINGVADPIHIIHNEFPGQQNIGQSRRFIIYRDSTSANEDDRFPGKVGMLTVRVW